MPKYLWIETRQSIEYDVLHYMERGACQGCHVVSMAAKTSRPLNRAQVSAAMQRLKGYGLIKREGCRWEFTNPAMREVQFDYDAQRAQAQKGQA